MRRLTPASSAPVIAIAAIIALIAAGGLFVRGGEEDTYRVTAFFPRAIGLFERSTVRVLGVEVGRIAEVAPEGDRVRVEMDIDEQIRIPSSATAVIVPISLISDRYVQLTPVWRSGAQLEDGDDIPLSRGVAPAELDDLLATLKKFLEALEPGTANAPGALGRFIQNADKALAGRGAQLGVTIDTLATLLGTLGRNVDSVDATIVNLDRLFGRLAAHDADLQATNRGLATVMSALANEEAALESGTGNLATLVGELGSLVRAHRSDLEADIGILADVATVLVRQKDRLITNILWLPVLSKGAAGAFDKENRRVLVRDATPFIKP
jgi:phospholipid/cholesterol/gamma-HCH transport system substrate-binding protein